MFSVYHALESIYNQFIDFTIQKTFKVCRVFGLHRQLKSYKIDVIIKILGFFFWGGGVQKRTFYHQKGKLKMIHKGV